MSGRILAGFNTLIEKITSKIIYTTLITILHATVIIPFKRDSAIVCVSACYKHTNARTHAHTHEHRQANSFRLNQSSMLKPTLEHETICFTSNSVYCII